MRDRQDRGLRLHCKECEIQTKQIIEYAISLTQESRIFKEKEGWISTSIGSLENILIK